MKESNEALKEYGILIALIVIAIFLSIITGGDFCSPRNLTNLARQVTFIGILAVGVTMVILLGEIDLSVGSLVAVTGVVAALAQVAGWGVVLTVFVALLVGAVLGIWNGYWISKYKIHSFIITLGMMVIARGLALILAKGASVGPTTEAFRKLGGASIPPLLSALLIFACFLLWLGGIFYGRKKQKEYGFALPGRFQEIEKIIIGTLVFLFIGWIFYSYEGIPLPVVIFALITLAGIFVLDNTPFGRHLYAIGGNIEASRLAGINVDRVKFIVFVITALLSAVSGILLTSRLDGATPATLGLMYELDTIASVVIGGTSLSGGSGHISKTIIGTFLIGTLSNGMSLKGIPTIWQYVVKGLIITFAAWFDARTKKQH